MPRRIVPSWSLASLLLAAVLGTGCQTTIGNYFANRARDFGECFRLQVGAGKGVGGAVRAGGLVHAGLLFGGSSRDLGIGWVYGSGYAFGAGASGKKGSDREGGFTILNFDLHEELVPRRGREDELVLEEHFCFGLLPAIFSSVNDKNLWTNQALNASPRAHVHAFDIEAEVHALFLFTKVGFSPGELVDFLLGWFGADIAQDDRSLQVTD